MMKSFDEIVEYLTSDGRWDELAQSIEENGIKEMKCQKCSDRHSVLHYICHFRPPLFIIKEIIDNYPSCLKSKDCDKRLPLHVALGSGCYSNVISYMVSKNAKAVSCRDKYGRLPIHLSFDNIHVQESESSKDNARRSSMSNDRIKDLNRSLACLCNASPRTIVMEDNEGLTVIERAIEMEVDINIYRNLIKHATKARDLSKSCAF